MQFLRILLDKMFTFEESSQIVEGCVIIVTGPSRNFKRIFRVQFYTVGIPIDNDYLLDKLIYSNCY